MSRPSRTMRPAEGASNPATMRNNVDLPQPDAPTITSISPRSSDKSIECNTSVAPKLFRTPVRSSMAILFFAFRQAGDKPTLHDHDDHDRWDQCQHRRGHRRAPIGFRFDRDHFNNPDHDRVEARVGRDKQRPEILIPTV